MTAPAAAPARSLDRHSPMPLWAQLLADLDRRLAAGAFDAHFPGEMDLVSEYEVSRHTVREALRRMRDRGVLDSTRGRATRVRTGIEQPLGALYSLFREVEARGMVQTSQVRAQQMTTDADAAVLLDQAASAELFYLERIRLADGEPLAHDRVWLTADLGRALLGADFGRTALYDEIAARSGARLTDGTEKINAVNATPTERALLHLPRGVACLRVERLGRLSGRPVERRITLVRGDRYTMIADWSSRGYSVGAQARQSTETAPVSPRARSATPR
ncbi:MAG: GntR family transcriptional regulator [Kineosporiaceae bacterium]